MIIVPRAGHGSTARVDYEPSRYAAYPRVLLAIASDAVRRPLSYALRIDGFDAVPFRDGDALARHLSMTGRRRRRCQDLVILDEAAVSPAALDAVIAAQGAGDAVPVVLIATAPPRELVRASALRVAAVFGQAFELDDLRTAVTNLVPEVMA